MWELDYKEGWVPKNWCFQMMVLEKTLESPLDSEEIKSVNPKGNQPRIFIWRTYVEAEALSHLSKRTDSLEKTLMLGQIESRRRGWQRIRWLDSITNSMELSLSKHWEIVKDRGAWDAAVYRTPNSQTRQSDWTTVSQWLPNRLPASGLSQHQSILPHLLKI